MPKLKLTNQRHEILNYLKSVKTHPAAEEVYAAVRKKLPRISLATVYRNLNMLSEKNEILKIDLKKSHFDGDTKGHDHLICKKCNKIIDIPSITSKFPNYSKKYNFKIESARTYFYGLCDKCK